MDLTILGGMGGSEAARIVLDINPEAQLTVSSGYSNDPIMADYRQYGFGSVVVKPYSFAEIAGTLNNLLNAGK
jgi:DNA-binding NarL/FixJ family response regulator